MTESWVNRHRVAIPMLAIHTIGAGGGSIAWVDDGGALRVGPDSAGAVPGPACYGRGGDRPTVTDADVLLGYLNPDYFLGGDLTLDVRAAERAVAAHVAGPLGLGVMDAAEVIFTVANNAMSIVGPAIIEHVGTTIVVYPEREALIDPYENCVIEVRREEGVG